MADVYGIQPEDVSAEMPGLFSVGFTQATRPTLATVTSWITDADAFVDTVVTLVTTVNPDLADAASRLARRYIISDVKARVLEASANLSATDIAALRQSNPASTLLTQLEALATSEIAAQLQALQEAELAGPRVAVSPTTAPRDLLIDDIDLDPHLGGGRF